MKTSQSRYKSNQKDKNKSLGDNIGIGTFKTDKHETSANAALQKQEELIKVLEECSKERDRLELEIKQREDRFYKREIEYRRIINELENEIKKKSASKNFDLESGQNIRGGLLDEINTNIENIQLKTSKILVDQEKDIIKFFNNKIFEIKKQFEEERIKKGKKEQDYIEKENQLISELEWIKNIAQKIDDENHTLMQQYMDLKAQYQTQENDREMLLKELIMKKKKNAILKSQIEQYQKLYNEVSKEGEENDMTQTLNKTSKSYGQVKGRNDQSQMNSQMFNKSQVDQVQIQEQQLQIRSQKTLKTLYSTLTKEERRLQKLKALYVKELESQSELEIIIRNTVEELQHEMEQERTKTDFRASQKQQLKPIDHNNKEFRERLIDYLLNNDKILTIVYDKTFYPDIKNLDNSASNFDYGEELQNGDQVPKDFNF